LFFGAIHSGVGARRRDDSGSGGGGGSEPTSTVRHRHRCHGRAYGNIRPVAVIGRRRRRRRHRRRRRPLRRRPVDRFAGAGVNPLAVVRPCVYSRTRLEAGR